MATNDEGENAPGRVDFFGAPRPATWDDDKTGRVTIRVFELDEAEARAARRKRTISGLFDLHPIAERDEPAA